MGATGAAAGPQPHGPPHTGPLHSQVTAQSPRGPSDVRDLSGEGEPNAGWGRGGTQTSMRKKSTEEGAGQRGRDCLPSAGAAPHRERGRPSRGREGARAGWGSMGPGGFWLTGCGPPERGENRLRRVWSCPRGGEVQLSPQPGPQRQGKGRARPYTGGNLATSPGRHWSPLTFPTGLFQTPGSSPWPRAPSSGPAPEELSQ